MDLRYIRYFIAVAEEKSFTRAALRLHTVQPSLSRQVRRLEELVGTPLLLRDKHKVDLTEAGEVFLDESRALLEQMNRAIERARQTAHAQAGVIALGYILGTESVLFSRLVPNLQHRYPSIKLTYRAMNETELIAALERKTISVAFCAGPIENAGIASEVALRQKVIAVLPAGHALARRQRIPLQLLAGVPLVLPSFAVAPNYREFLSGIARAAGIELECCIEHDNVLSALQSVSMGAGICLIPDYQQGILGKNLVTRELQLDPAPCFDLLAVYRKDDRSAALRCVLAVVRECLRPMADGDEALHRTAQRIPRTPRETKKQR